jgi:putative intracellular protease/amidase
MQLRGGGLMEVVKVKVKNKPNELKAVAFLGGYSQHKGLLDEVIKTLDWFDEVDKKIKKEA